MSGTLSVTKARLDGIEKNTTKTREYRQFELCPRGVAVLKRQLKLREELRQAGRIDHDQIFFTENGKRFRDIDDPSGGPGSSDRNLSLISGRIC